MIEAPLSIRALARALRMDRDKAAELVRRGTVRTIPWGSTRRVPASEAHRLAEAGFTPAGRRPRAPKPRAPRSPAAVAAAVRAIPLGDS